MEKKEQFPKILARKNHTPKSRAEFATTFHCTPKTNESNLQKILNFYLYFDKLNQYNKPSFLLLKTLLKTTT